MTDENRRWIYARHVEGALTPEHFELRHEAVPVPGLGQTLVRVRMVSIDPTNRNWILRPGYLPQVMPGQAMSAFGIGEIVETRDPYRFKVGDIVHGNLGWQDYAVLNSFDRQEYVHLCTQTGRSREDQIGIFGVTGLTAYFGLEKLGPFTRGETLVVAGASGACGSILGQLARVRGCRVVGIAGGSLKCARVRDELRFDAVVNYQAANFVEQLRAACPDGVSAFSDGVGGAVASATYRLLVPRARVLDYGNIANYDANSAAAFQAGSVKRGRTAEENALLEEREVRCERLLVFDHYCSREAAVREMASLMEQGEMIAPATVIEGFEALPDALVGVFANDGSRFGKVSVEIG
jgi:NADPH-dependent curcumin reductase CurA